MAKDALKYVNHLGSSISFGENGLYIDESDLRDWSYSYTNKNGKLVNFYKDVSEKTIPVVVMASSEEEGKKLRDELYEIISADIEAGEYGTLQYNGYEMKCYVSASTHKSWLEYYAFGDIELKVVTDLPFWTKSTSFEVNAADFLNSVTDENSKSYDRDYEFDYGFAETTAVVNNNSASDAYFKLDIIGFAENPSVTIGGNVYSLNCTVPHGSVATINSLEKTITVKSSSGTVTDIFSSRTSTSVFKSIPAGESVIYWDKSFNLILTLISKRSEPPWIW